MRDRDEINRLAVLVADGKTTFTAALAQVEQFAPAATVPDFEQLCRLVQLREGFEAGALDWSLGDPLAEKGGPDPYEATARMLETDIAETQDILLGLKYASTGGLL